MWLPVILFTTPQIWQSDTQPPPKFSPEHRGKAPMAPSSYPERGRLQIHGGQAGEALLRCSKTHLNHGEVADDDFVPLLAVIDLPSVGLA